MLLSHDRLHLYSYVLHIITQCCTVLNAYPYLYYKVESLSVCLFRNHGQTADPIVMKLHIEILEGLGMDLGYFSHIRNIIDIILKYLTPLTYLFDHIY